MFGLFPICLFFHALSLVGANISPVSAKGAKLYDNAGNQFFIRGVYGEASNSAGLADQNPDSGVAYAPGDDESDPLLDTTRCQTDAALMKKASINTIYVYTIDSTQDHDGCMTAFAGQGIYVWLQLGDFPRATSSVRLPFPSSPVPPRKPPNQTTRPNAPHNGPSPSTPPSPK